MELAVFAGVLALQAGLLALLFAVVFLGRSGVQPSLRRHAPFFLGTALLLAPLLAWMGVQLMSSGQPQAVLIASAASSPATSSYKPVSSVSGPDNALKESESWEAAASFTAQQIELGKRVAQEQNCTACHSIRGKGGVIAPDLSTVKERRSPLWIYRHFQEPQAVSPGSLMPKFQLSERELIALTAYIWTLQE